MKGMIFAIIFAGLVAFWNGAISPAYPYDSLIPLAHITPTYPYDPDDDEDPDRVRPTRPKETN